MPTSPIEKTQVAITLQYDGESAPKVTAKGQGHIAEQILELAKAHNIPIQKNAELANLLSQVELDQNIPSELYEAVVQVLIFAYEVSKKEIPKPKNQTNN